MHNLHNFTCGMGYQPRRDDQYHQGARIVDMRSLVAALSMASPGTGEVQRTLMSGSFRPRLPGLTKIVSQLSRQNQWQKGLEIYECLESLNITPDTMITNAAISACDRGGHWQKAVEIFRSMEAQGLRRDGFTYSSLISALAKGRQWELAIDVFNHMVNSNVACDAVTCCSLITALDKGGQWQLAEQVFIRMYAGHPELHPLADCVSGQEAPSRDPPNITALLHQLLASGQLAAAPPSESSPALSSRSSLPSDHTLSPPRTTATPSDHTASPDRSRGSLSPARPFSPGRGAEPPAGEEAQDGETFRLDGGARLSSCDPVYEPDPSRSPPQHAVGTPAGAAAGSKSPHSRTLSCGASLSQEGTGLGSGSGSGGSYQSSPPHMSPPRQQVEGSQERPLMRADSVSSIHSPLMLKERSSLGQVPLASTGLTPQALASLLSVTSGARQDHDAPLPPTHASPNGSPTPAAMPYGLPPPLCPSLSLGAAADSFNAALNSAMTAEDYGMAGWAAAGAGAPQEGPAGYEGWHQGGALPSAISLPSEALAAMAERMGGNWQPQGMLRRTISAPEPPMQQSSGMLRTSSLSAKKPAPNRVCCNALLAAYARAAGSAQWGKALRLLECMWSLAGELAPDIVSYNTVMKALGNARQTQLAYQVYHVMVARGVRPTVATFVTLISSAHDSGDSDKVRAAWRWLTGSGLPLHISCINSYLATFVKEEAGEEAFRVFAMLQLPDSPVRPNTTTYNLIISALLARGEYTRVKRLFEEMAVAGVPASSGTYEALLAALVHLGELDDAVAVLGQMARPGSSVRPNSTMLSTVLLAIYQSMQAPGAEGGRGQRDAMRMTALYELAQQHPALLADPTTRQLFVTLTSLMAADAMAGRQARSPASPGAALQHPPATYGGCGGSMGMGGDWCLSPQAGHYGLAPGLGGHGGGFLGQGGVPPQQRSQATSDAQHLGGLLATLRLAADASRDGRHHHGPSF